MADTVLARLASADFTGAGDRPVTPTLTSTQTEVDHLVSSFVQGASDPYTLTGMVVGSAAYRLIRIGGLASLGRFAGVSPTIAPQVIRAVSVGTGLVGEAGTFELTQRGLRVGLGGADRSLLAWEGPNGLRNGWTHSVISFGALKGAGYTARGEGVVLQHTLQSSAMVASHNLSAALGITDKPRGSLAEQFAEAEVMNVQILAGMSLVHRAVPALAQAERSLDLQIQSREINFLPQFQALFQARALSFAAAESGAGYERAYPAPDSVAEFLSRPLLMAAEGDGGGETEQARGGNGQATKVAERPATVISPPPREPVEKIERSQPFMQLRHLVPNGLTTAAALMAIVGAAHSVHGDFSLAAKLLVVAAVLDKADGLVARAMKATHPLGARLDSYADFANYGLASAIFTYAYLQHHGESLAAWTAALLIGLNATLRLATFDHLDEHPEVAPERDVLGNRVIGSGKDFVGMPSTMMGLLLPAAYWVFRDSPLAFAEAMLISATAMYAPLRYGKLTDTILGRVARGIKRVVYNPAKLVVAGGVVGILSYLGYQHPEVSVPLLQVATMGGLGSYVASPFIEASSRWMHNGRERLRVRRRRPPAPPPAASASQ